jgi:hypothetical protein
MPAPPAVPAAPVVPATAPPLDPAVPVALFELLQADASPATISADMLVRTLDIPNHYHQGVWQSQTYQPSEAW